jgi:hypothetical protein
VSGVAAGDPVIVEGQTGLPDGAPITTAAPSPPAPKDGEK